MADYQTIEGVIDALRAAQKACANAERKIMELVGIIDRLRANWPKGTELPEADRSSHHSG